jgi:hypothetical protein
MRHLFLLSALLLSLVGAASGQRSTYSSDMASTQVVSPVALATLMTRSEVRGQPRELALLVIWRGTPAWFINPGSANRESGGGGPDSVWVKIQRGDLAFELDLNVKTRAATIQGHTLDLRDANVILLDEVDTAAGPKVAATLRIDPAIDDEKRLELVLRRSPQIVSFLRCDVTLADPGLQRAIARVCAAIIAK